MVVVSQLVGKVEISGADQAKTILLGMDTNSKKAQQSLDQLQKAAKDAGSILGNRFTAEIKNAQGGMQDLGRRAESAGLDVSKFTSLQLKASEAASKLGLAQANAANALQKANAAVAGGKATTEQMAVAQGRAAVAAENVSKAENAASVAMQKVQGEASRLSEAMQQDATETNIFSRALEAVKGMLSSVGSQANSTSSEMSELGEKASQSSGGMFSGFKHAAGGLLDFGSKVGLTVMGIQGLVQGAMNLGGALLEPIASAEQLGISFTTLLGGSQKAATELIGTLNHFADITPFEPQPVQQYAAQLIGMGIDAKQTIPIMTSLGDALFGIGHGTEAEMASVVDQIGKIKIAGVATWGDISQLQTHGIDALGAMSLATGKTKESLRDLAGHGGIPAKEAIDALTKGIEMNPLYQGGMAKQAASLSGVLSTMSGYLKTGLNSFLGLKDGMVITGSIIDQVKTGIKGLGDVVSSPVFQSFAEGAGKAVANMFGAIGNVLQNTVVPWFHTFQEVIQLPAMRGLGERLGQVWDALKGVGGAFSDLFGAISPFGDLFKRNTQTVGDGETALDNWAIAIFKVQDVIQNYIVPAIDIFGEVIRKVTPFLQGEFNHALQDVGAVAKQIGDWFKSDVQPALQAVAPSFASLGDTLLNTVVPALFKAREIGVSFIEHVFKDFGPIAEKIVPPLIRFAGIVAGGLSDAIKFITPYILDAAGAISSFASDISDRVAPIISKWITDLTPLVEAFMNNWKQSWPTISAVIKGVWDEVVGTVKIAWALLSGVIKIGLDLISGNWGQVWTDMKDMLGGVWDGIKNYVKGGIEVIAGLFKPFLDAAANVPGPVGDMARKVSDSFTTMADGIDGKTKDARDQADLHTLEMKMKAIDNADLTQQGVIKKFDLMRLGIIDQLSKTHDETEKHSLEIKLSQVTNAEDAAKKTLDAHKQMRTNVEAEHKQLKKSIDDNSGGIVGSIQRWFGGIGQWFTGWFTEAKNGVIEAFGAIGQWLGDRWKDVQNIWGGAGQWFQDIGHRIWNGITGFFGGIGQWFNGRWQDVINYTAPFRNYMGAVFSTIWDIVVALWGRLGAKFNEWLEGAKAYLAPFVNAVRDKFTEAWNAVVGAFQWLGKYFSDRWQDVKNILGGVGQVFHDVFQGAWNKVVGVWNFLGKMFSDRWQDVKNILAPVGQVFHDIFQGAWNKVVEIWTPIGKKFQGFWDGIVAGIDKMNKDAKAKFEAFKTGVVDIFKGMINGIIDQLNNGISAFVGFINFFATKLNDLDKSLTGKQTNPIPMIQYKPIPHYAKGTESHPGGPMIVGEEGPEMVMAPRGTKVATHKETMQILAAMGGGNVPGYASGIGDLGSQVMSWIAGGAKNVLNNLLSGIKAPNILGISDLGTGLLNKVKDWALSFINGILPKIDFGGTSVPGNVQSWIAAAMALTHVPASWAGPLATIAMKESGGRSDAINLTDSNALAGHPSQGIMQMIPSTFAAHALSGHKNILNPIDNIASSIGYIGGRYGDVWHVPGIASMARGGPYVGYARGGVLSEPVIGTGLRTGTNYSFAERGPETIVPGYIPSGVNLAQQSSQSVASSQHGGPREIILQIDGRTFARLTMPYNVSEIRNNVQVRI
jgi:SLT domain-containing protein/phage-related protein